MVPNASQIFGHAVYMVASSKKQPKHGGTHGTNADCLPACNGNMHLF